LGARHPAKTRLFKGPNNAVLPKQQKGPRLSQKEGWRARGWDM